MTFRRMFATIRAMPPCTRVRDTAPPHAMRSPRATPAWNRPRMRHATYIKPAAAWWTNPEDLECLT